MRLHISKPLLGEIERQCLSSYPREAAGLLFGRDDLGARTVVEVQPIENSFEEREQKHRYLIDPRAMLEADERADELGLVIVGVYHSHPDHPALPSEFDRSNAWPWLIYTITSVQDGSIGQTRGWLLDENRGQFDEVELVIDEVFQEKS